MLIFVLNLCLTSSLCHQALHRACNVPRHKSLFCVNFSFSWRDLMPEILASPDIVLLKLSLGHLLCDPHVSDCFFSICDPHVSTFFSWSLLTMFAKCSFFLSLPLSWIHFFFYLPHCKLITSYLSHITNYNPSPHKYKLPHQSLSHHKL